MNAEERGRKSARAQTTAQDRDPGIGSNALPLPICVHLRASAVPLCTLALLLVVMTGCGAATKADTSQRTGGIALDLLVERDDDSRAFYRVFPDGMIGYAGGADARARRITWTGTMSDEQINDLLGLLNEHGWRRREPRPGEHPEQVTYRIDLRGPEGRARYEVRGESEDVLPIYNHLRGVAMQRFEHVLETLPRPSAEATSP